jgi:hypothetical protein
MMVKEAVLTEVFSTPKGSVYQCDATNSFIVEFAGTTTRFNVKQFLICDYKYKLFSNTDIN